MAAQFPSEYQCIFPFLAGLSDGPALVVAWRKIACAAVELFDVEDCAVGLLDEQGTHLLLLATAPEEKGHEQPTGVPFALHTSPLALFVRERAPLVLPDAPFNARLQASSGCLLACLPLFEGERLLGGLLASSAVSVPFTERRLRQLALLADQAALVISNARQAERAKVAERAKATFLSLLTHELRSPLNSINGYLDLLLDGLAGDLNEQQREFIRRSRAGSEYLYTLLEDLLLTARVDVGQLRLKREAVVLPDLIHDVLEGLELAASDAGVVLETRIPAAFPMLSADSIRLQQILRNLFNNAIRFTPAGGYITLAARIVPNQRDGERELVEISLHDTGYGIASEYHERIFERFFQLPHAAGGRISGQGLGLAVVKMLVELHGGRVRVESAPGEGSTFIFTLDAL